MTLSRPEQERHIATKASSPFQQEMDKKRWLVRYLLLSAIGIVIAFKLYFISYVDFVVGLYSFLTSFVIFSTLLVSYTKFRDPYIKAKNASLYSCAPLHYCTPDTLPVPLIVSIIIPVKNEEGNIRDCVQSCINSTYKNKEIIVVDDGSTDKTPQILDQMQNESSNSSTEDLHIIHLPKNVGKKKAIEYGTKIARGEIYVFTDSDCYIAIDAVENAVLIFMSDKDIGGLTGHIRERGVEEGGFLRKMLDVRADGACRLIKGMESYYSSVTCCSGPFTAYRKEAIQQHIHAWANDRFIGREFKFSTDRRLTAFVLAAHKIKSNEDKTVRHRTNRACNNNYNKAHYKDIPWKVQYSQTMKVYCREPETLRGLVKQRIRWQKSFIRSIFATGAIYWRRPFFAALIYYLQTGLRILRPYILLKSLILLPAYGDYITPIFYLTGVFFTGMIYGIDFRLRNPGNTEWLYRIPMQLMTIFIFTWLLLYAAITIRKMTWR